MMAGTFDARLWVALILLIAVATGLIRLWLWQRAAAVADRAPAWRLLTLAGLQVLAAALLWFTLFPPPAVLRSGTLIVATAGSPATIATVPGDVLVALPEAGEIEGAGRMPDLATALRRHASASRIRIEGQGLVPRDHTPLPLPVDFDPPPLPGGLIDVTLPDPAAPGAVVQVGGQVGTLPAGTVELVDPADTVVDRVRVVANQRFFLAASTRAPGLALFDLRLRDAAGRLVERIVVPVETRPQTPPRIRVLAGAPGPETKYLQRWAQDAGIDLGIDIDLGAGIQLGDAPLALNATALGAIDLVVIDDRRWEALGAGGRAALAGAVDRGMGLLLRPTGALSPATRRDWANLGLTLTGSGEVLPLQLDPPAAGPATPETPEPEPDALPELGRLDTTVTGTDAVSIIRDPEGTPLASWRARGRGRVGVWTVTDSYALVLTGRPDRYGELWSALFSDLARAGDASRATVPDIPRAGTRFAVCGLSGQASVIGPDGTGQPLRIDPATGDQACAGVWPERSGWHLVRDGRGRETNVFVQPADATPSLVAAAHRSATLALTHAAARTAASAASVQAEGSPWPWFIGLLATLTGLWGMERNRTIALPGWIRRLRPTGRQT
ncbi:hypothetical protein MMB232_02339 [Brevundimonas subvibrioides]|uniref:hypothetical protein n=1 Tax=Brevundimonas subvibrioides TaxID=74313 RepID=UPI0032D58CF7